MKQLVNGVLDPDAVTKPGEFYTPEERVRIKKRYEVGKLRLRQRLAKTDEPDWVLWIPLTLIVACGIGETVKGNVEAPIASAAAVMFCLLAPLYALAYLRRRLTKMRKVWRGHDDETRLIAKRMADQVRAGVWRPTDEQIRRNREYQKQLEADVAEYGFREALQRRSEERERLTESCPTVTLDGETLTVDAARDRLDEMRGGRDE